MSGDHTTELPAHREMSRESFEALLLEIKLGATLLISDAILAGRPEEGTRGDARAVWHAAEVALGILRPGYVPKREALDDVRSMMRWFDEDEGDWIGRD